MANQGDPAPDHSRSAYAHDRGACTGPGIPLLPRLFPVRALSDIHRAVEIDLCQFTPDPAAALAGPLIPSAPPSAVTHAKPPIYAIFGELGNQLVYGAVNPKNEVNRGALRVSFNRIRSTSVPGRTNHSHILTIMWPGRFTNCDKV